jgi:hypothetical protein
MIKGINGKPYISLDSFLDLQGFQQTFEETCRGFALAREYAKEGTWMAPGFDVKDLSYVPNWKPIYQAFAEYQALPNDHPIKVYGRDIFPRDFKDYKQRNIFTRYLKATLGANDPYLYYFLWEEGSWDERNAERRKTKESQYFPGVVKWVENLLEENIIDQIGRVIFFHCDHDGHAFEHRDLDAKDGVKDRTHYTEHNNEFIHVRYRTKRGFYIWDPDTRDKHYINCRAAFWNDQDFHGGEWSKEQEFGLRIDCKFTEDFRRILGISGNY